MTKVQNLLLADRISDEIAQIIGISKDQLVYMLQQITASTTVGPHSSVLRCLNAIRRNLHHFMTVDEKFMDFWTLTFELDSKKAKIVFGQKVARHCFLEFIRCNLCRLSGEEQNGQRALLC